MMNETPLKTKTVKTKTDTQVEENDAVLFDAVLHPHASLTPRGFYLLMATVGVISFCAGVAFVIAGPWPVFGFFAIDIALVGIGCGNDESGNGQAQSYDLPADAEIDLETPAKQPVTPKDRCAVGVYHERQ